MDISDTLKELFDPYVPIYEKAAYEKGVKQGRALTKLIYNAQGMTQEQKQQAFEMADRMWKRGFSTVDVVIALNLSVEEYNREIEKWWMGRKVGFYISDDHHFHQDVIKGR